MNAWAPSETPRYICATFIDERRYVLTSDDGRWCVIRPDDLTPETTPFPDAAVRLIRNAMACPKVGAPRDALLAFLPELAPVPCVICKGTRSVPCKLCDGSGDADESCDTCNDKHVCSGGCTPCDGSGSIDCACQNALDAPQPAHFLTLPRLYDRRYVRAVVDRLPAGDVIQIGEDADQYLVLSVGDHHGIVVWISDKTTAEPPRFVVDTVPA